MGIDENVGSLGGLYRVWLNIVEATGKVVSTLWLATPASKNKGLFLVPYVIWVFCPVRRSLGVFKPSIVEPTK